MDQKIYFQEYQSKFKFKSLEIKYHEANTLFFCIGQYLAPYRENLYIYYAQNYFHENAHIDQQFLTYSAGQNRFPRKRHSTKVTDDDSEPICFDCLTSYAPTWRTRQDGKKVCNA